MAKAPKVPKAKAENRKLGERIETVSIKLSPMEIEDERAKVIDLIQTKDELEERLKSAKADYKAKIAEVDSQTAAALGAIRSGRVSRDVMIEEWLTPQNEVIRLNKATTEELGRRTASARELQADLPIDTSPPAPKAEGDDGEAEANREAEDDHGESSDFGDKA